jgi:hypothetical protein
MPRLCGRAVRSWGSSLLKDLRVLHDAVFFNLGWVKPGMVIRRQTSGSSQVFPTLYSVLSSFRAGFVHIINTPY